MFKAIKKLNSFLGYWVAKAVCSGLGVISKLLPASMSELWKQHVDEAASLGVKVFIKSVKEEMVLPPVKTSYPSEELQRDILKALEEVMKRTSRPNPAAKWVRTKENANG